MKKSIIAIGFITLLTGSLFAKNNVQKFNYESGVSTGVINKTIITFYDEKDLSDIDSESGRDILLNVLKNSTCEDKNQRKIIEDMHYNIVYLYKNKDNKSITAVNIDNCSK